MKAFLNRDGQIVLRSECPNDDKGLKRLWRAGHLHLACKALMDGNRTRLEASRPDTTKALRLFLVPSIIRWRRPAARRRT